MATLLPKSALMIVELYSPTGTVKSLKQRQVVSECRNVDSAYSHGTIFKPKSKPQVARGPALNEIILDSSNSTPKEDLRAMSRLFSNAIRNSLISLNAWRFVNVDCDIIARKAASENLPLYHLLKRQSFSAHPHPYHASLSDDPLKEQNKFQNFHVFKKFAVRDDNRNSLRFFQEYCAYSQSLK